ncbi:MFS transporter [Paenibacillus solisilvae]|uniref:MFS transporter n=1 Tax=Paenibacillus solisilvae TaxID=2486751 RepID=A0ABW0W0H3_9BACL
MSILAAYYFFLYLSMSVFVPYTSLYFSEKGFSTAAVGMILSLWAFVSIIAQPVMGLINDRIGNPRKIIMISVITAPVIGLGFHYTNEFSAVIALSVLFTWSHSSAGPLSDSIAVEIGNRAGFNFGSIRMWGALSYSLGTISTGFLYEKYGYANIFEYYLAVSVLVFALLFGFPKSKTFSHKITFLEQAIEVIGNKPFMAYLAICLLLVMSMVSSSTFLPIYFQEMDFDKRFLGSAFAVAALIEVPMFWVASKLSQAIGRFRLLSLSAVIYALKCLILFFFHNVYLTLGVQLLDGISFAFAAGTFVEVVETYSRKNTKATFQTIFVAVSSGMGGVIGIAAGGIIVEYWGTPFLYLVLFILCLAASALFFGLQHANVTKIQMTDRSNIYR